MVFKSPYGEGLAGLLLDRSPHIRYMMSTSDIYRKQRKEIIRVGMNRIQDYLRSEGINSEYKPRRHTIEADLADFN